MLYMLRMSWEVALGMMMNGETPLLAYQMSFLPLGLFESYERHKSVVCVVFNKHEIQITSTNFHINTPPNPVAARCIIA
jgi:hypothetical protein